MVNAMNTIRFTPDCATYIRSNAWLAAFAMAGAMAVLWLVGEAHVWTGAVGGLAAIALRAWYLADEELAAEWLLSGDTLTGPGGRAVRLGDIAQVRSLGPMVQIITQGGDKHLIKHQPDPARAVAQIKAAVARGHA